MTTLAIFWSSRDWATAIAGLPAIGPLPCRTVLVPREAVAHSLRRELLRMGRPDALAGTRFVPTTVAAAEVLRAAGVEFKTGEERLRPARLLVLFRGGLGLEHFPLDLLRSRPGWDEAFARTIGDLEAAGLRPEELRGAARPTLLRDLGAIWHAVDGSAGASWTIARLYLEAARLLESRSELWPFPGPTLATATGSAFAAQARFLRAIPDVALGLLAARPVRRHYLDRIETLFGSDTRRTVEAARAPRSTPSERDLLASYLFEPPHVLADPGRPRSPGPDGAVSLEEHAGIEDEVEATADWRARSSTAWRWRTSPSSRPCWTRSQN